MLETFKTTDMYVASYLKAVGNRIEVVEKDGDGRVVFIFRGSGLWDTANGYYNNEPVPVSDFVKAVQDIKSLIFDTR